MQPLKTPLLIDSHEDIAWNILTFGRDYTRSVSQIRASEAGGLAPVHNNDTLLGWDAYQRANTGVIFGTLFCAPIATKEGDWDTQTYADAKQAHRLYRSQLDAYRRLADEKPDFFRLIQNRSDLQNLLQLRAEIDSEKSRPIGLVTLMEGADGITQPDQVADWVEWGVRLIGLAWQATRYSGGTHEPGPLTQEGVRLLKRMDDLGCVLDLSHMDEKAVWQAFDRFSGRVMASHINPNHFLQERNSNRFLKDDVIREIANRSGVMGLVPYNIFLDPTWVKNGSARRTSIHNLVEQMDYVCQLTGSVKHVAIGTDFDGGFGLQNAPEEIDSIGDLPVMIPLLRERGYSEDDIADIFGQNWLRFLLEVLT